MNSILPVGLLVAAASVAIAQPPPGVPVWTGFVRCSVEVKGPGYVNHQTHTWTLDGTLAPGGSALDYPGTWSVTGEGAMQSGPQPATWKTKGSAPGVRMAIFVRPADQRLVVFLRHGPLTAAGATLLVRQTTPSPPAPAAEWRPFPTIADDPKSTHITGSSTDPTTARLDAMQPLGSQGQVVCTWDLSQTGVASSGSVAGPPASMPKGAVAPKNAPTAPAVPPASTVSSAPRVPSAPPGATAGPPPKPTVGGCAGAGGKVVDVSRGQSQTVTGTIKTAGSIDWMTVKFIAGASLRLTISNAAPAADASDFQMQAFSDCSTMIVMTTGIGTKTLDFPDSGPHAVLVRIVANQWNAASPTYSLKLEGR